MMFLYRIPNDGGFAKPKKFTDVRKSTRRMPDKSYSTSFWPHEIANLNDLNKREGIRISCKIKNLPVLIVICITN